MLTKVDWISFSIPMDVSKMENEQDAPAQIVAALEHLHEELPEWLSLSSEFEAGNGRAPYRTSWRRADGGMVVFSHPALSHALIEISGRGCDRLDDEDNLRNVLSATHHRITRIDVACDIATSVRPLAFVQEGYSGKFKARSYVVSESGETFYVGAKTSNRYARVYRYNFPHERHNLLRVEYVIKAEDAKITAKSILEQGLRPVVASLGEVYGWLSSEWRIEDEAAELLVYRPDRREGKTLFWLNDTIAPLLARLQREDVLSLDEWIETVVKPLVNR